MSPAIAFNYVEVSSLPKLAWSVQFDCTTGQVTIVHGAAVETRKDGFFEGSFR
jgi:hypothetical protein